MIFVNNALDDGSAVLLYRTKETEDQNSFQFPTGSNKHMGQVG